MNTDSRICNRTKMKLSYVCVAVVHVRNSTENERKKNRLRCVHHRQPTTNNGIDNVEQKAKPKANCNAISSSHTFNSMFIIPFECDAAYTLYLGRLSPPYPSPPLRRCWTILVMFLWRFVAFTQNYSARLHFTQLHVCRMAHIISPFTQFLARPNKSTLPLAQQRRRRQTNEIKSCNAKVRKTIPHTHGNRGNNEGTSSMHERSHCSSSAAAAKCMRRTTTAITPPRRIECTKWKHKRCIRWKNRFAFAVAFSLFTVTVVSLSARKVKTKERKNTRANERFSLRVFCV